MTHSTFLLIESSSEMGRKLVGAHKLQRGLGIGDTTENFQGL